MQNWKYQGVSHCLDQFFCIIRQINFNVYISCKTFKRLRKVMTHFYMRSFLLIQLLKRLPFPFDIQFITFSFNYLFYSKFLLTIFLQFFLVKSSSNFITIQVTNNISARNCIFNFTNNKNVFWPIWSVYFSKNVFLFWNSNMITKFKFRVFFIKIFILFSIRIIRNINRFHFNNFMSCVIVYINNNI